MRIRNFYANLKGIAQYKETIQDIAKWHEKSFPMASEVDQKKKFKEELKEWKESHDILELADMYIVACGMTRFPTLDAQIAFHTINEICLLEAIKSSLLLNAVDEKMQINRKRQWERKSSGVYKHID